MKPLLLHNDMMPIGEFKTQASRVLRRLKEAGRPVVITQHGRPAGVLIPTADYDRLMERERFVVAVERGLAESEAGLGVADEDLNAVLDRNFGPVESA